MIEQLSNYPRRVRLLITALTDIFISVFSIWAAISLRFGELVPLHGKWWPLFVAIAVIATPIFIRTGLYRSVIRHFSLHSVKVIVIATGAAITLWALFALAISIEGFPRSSILIGWLVLFVLTFLTRLIMYALFVIYRQKTSAHAIAVHGTSQQAIQVASVLRNSPGYTPVCFVGGDPTMYGREIEGLRVYPTKDLGGLVKRHKIKYVLTTGDDDGDERRLLLDALSTEPIKVINIPSLSELVDQPVEFNRFGHVEIEELLGRQKVAPNQELLKSGATGHNVLVTGAGGSIGAQLCRKMFSLGANTIVLAEQSEHALFQIHRQLTQTRHDKTANAAPKVIACLGSVEDSSFITDIITEHSIDLIYHAAAYKHVPLLEDNVLAGVRNNVLGTKSVAEAAAQAGVKHFVLVSTDKAVRPISFMGASKRVAEMVIQVLARKYQDTCFCIVRFGNVLGSSGSVIPIFREQIQKGEAVTVTDPEAERYFMTIEEAVELIVQAGAMAKSGDVFLLDMGESVKIGDVARKMVHLSGLRLKNDGTDAEGDIEIRYIGLRPGEKLREELYLDAHPVNTLHPKIMQDNQQFSLNYDEFMAILAKIESMLSTRDTKGLKNLLTELMPSFGMQDEGLPDSQ